MDGDRFPNGRPALVEADDLWLTVPARPGRVNPRDGGARGDGALTILHGVSLRVAEGEAVGLVGPSGSGKTSLLMLLAGLERPTRGTIRIAGTRLDTLDENAMARFRRQTTGIVFQSFQLIPTMTALENVLVPLELAGRSDGMAAATASLDAVGLAHRLGHLPAELSGGEQQRVALARAFVTRPRLLLADEPTGNLDTRTGAAVVDLLFSLQRQYGTTLLLITHDTALAARCGRCVQVRDGHLEDGRLESEQPARPSAP
ncbi:ABC transporter related [Gluconacetobacter diazotrophicus PA1 5]|uniref:ATP-binding cassette domain-containing protein n=2 Tax=Gluconacetobacter diazotrophicus TaxID=33996 RepID=A0A7W4I5B9_GLUDI|nr:ATP-binding cassette domain-containing protein [Gluconacetobacter diazotrophicus]ACI51690.1 ABC transporter related [Gluconacetobacter diazotrophicus PA1 5]MBB2155270.1 ATP-binding cassette domain-containing protein [Gluconacetobacter diazotrophicus]TWB11034.1 putative ABC transport system ATP-binding protein [Gluconacetobacter diazotrophicus]CAP55161.1 putative ABC transporter, ATP-binding protein [Gluconacetobacter diazotrophicus PA1 5]